MRYKYIGKTEAVVFDLGVISPGEIIKTDIIINHPLFKLVPNKKRET